MRIGYVIWSLGLGGAEQVVISLALQMAERGHHVTVFTLNEPGLFANRLQAQGITVVSLGKRGRIDLGLIGRLRRAYLAHRLDVVHTHLWGANLWGRIAARRAGIPVVITEHNVDTWKRPLHLALDRALAPWAEERIAVSWQVREFYERHRVAAGRWQVIHNGIELPPPAGRRRGAAYAGLGIGEQALVVGLVGRLVPAKAPERFVQAVAAAAQRVPGLTALIVGDGPLRQATERQAQRLGAQDRVILTGLRQDVPELLAGMDALVFSSEREGLSMAMLEAMAAGVPVIATRVGGNPELIDSEATGVLVEPGRPDVLAEALVSLLADPAKARAIGAAGRARVATHFSLRAMVDAHERVYQTVVINSKNQAPVTKFQEPNSKLQTGLELGAWNLEFDRPAPIRVCYVIDHLDVGGAQRQLVELIRQLDRRRWEPVVVCLSTSRVALRDELESLGVPVRVVAQHGRLDGRCLSDLTQLLAWLKPAVVHTWLFTADCYGRLAARLAGVPHVVCALRNTIDDMAWHHRLVNRWLSPLAQRVTVNAEAIRDGFVRRGGVPDRKIRTIYNGLDLARYDASRNGHRRQDWQLPESGAIVAMIARLAAQKDHDTFLEAARRVNRQRPQALFLLVGDGPRRRAIERRVAAMGLSGSVRLLGERRDVWPLLHAVDVCALATRFEGCSNVIMEAMAAAKPVVASDVGGNRELIEHGQTGYLVPPKDPEALAQAILDLLGDPAKAQAMGRAGRHRVEERFTIQRAAAETEALYSELLRNRCEV